MLELMDNRCLLPLTVKTKELKTYNRHHRYLGQGTLSYLLMKWVRFTTYSTTGNPFCLHFESALMSSIFFFFFSGDVLSQSEIILGPIWEQMDQSHLE